MSDPKRSQIHVGISLSAGDHPSPKWFLGTCYAGLKPEGVVAIQQVIQKPEVKVAFDAFLNAFGQEASKYGVMLANKRTGDPETLEAVLDLDERR